MTVKRLLVAGGIALLIALATFLLFVLYATQIGGPGGDPL